MLILLALFSFQAPSQIDVAVYDDKGTGKSIKNLVKVLDRFPEFKVRRIKAKDVKAGTLKDFDVVIHPGGSGGGQGRHLGSEGRERIRSFVSEGGGYVGFCAGAYLASNDYSWSLNLIDAKVIDKKHWARGVGTVTLNLTEAGRKLLNVQESEVEIYYGQGPLLVPKGDDNVPDYNLLATYKTEIAKKGAPTGVMKGTAAIVSGSFGKGRVFCFSPHPEKTKGLERFVQRAVTWAAKRCS